MRCANLLHDITILTRLSFYDDHLPETSANDEVGAAGQVVEAQRCSLVTIEGGLAEQAAREGVKDDGLCRRYGGSLCVGRLCAACIAHAALRPLHVDVAASGGDAQAVGQGDCFIGDGAEGFEGGRGGEVVGEDELVGSAARQVPPADEASAFVVGAFSLTVAA